MSKHDRGVMQFVDIGKRLGISTDCAESTYKRAMYKLRKKVVLQNATELDVEDILIAMAKTQSYEQVGLRNTDS